MDKYEVGKEYELPKGELTKVCKNGFHACESPLEVLDYYFLDDNANLSRFCEVEQSGEFSKEEDSTKVASSKIKIKAEITFADLIKLGIEWLKEKTSHEKDDANSETHLNDEVGYSAQIASSDYYVKIGSSGNDVKIGSSGYSAQIALSGDYTKIASSGNSAQIASSGNSAKIASSGCYAKIGSSGNDAKIGSSGYYAKVASSGLSAKIASSGGIAQIGSSGNDVKISSSGLSAQIASSGYHAKISSSGDHSKISSSGNYAQIDSTGENSVIVCAGHNSIARAKKGSWITLAEWYGDDSCVKMSPKCVKTEYVDGERIKEDTWYKLVDGEFVSLDTLED